MEFVAVKRGRCRKKRKHVKKRRRDQLKFEVKSMKHRKLVHDRANILIAREKLVASTMEADSFWKNYTVAQEWQKRHSVTWWRSRCFALEYENQVLRDKIRSLACSNTRQGSTVVRKSAPYQEEYENEPEDGADYDGPENENLEFQVDEDMMNFLEQSMRHKIELRKKRESDFIAEEQEKDEDEAEDQSGDAWNNARNNNAKLLYGDDSPTILAMETALQTTMDRHKDKAKPQFWPIIPLKP